MKDINELKKVLCDIEKEVKYAKEFSDKKEFTTTQEITFKYHLSKIQELSKDIKDILNS